MAIHWAGSTPLLLLVLLPTWTLLVGGYALLEFRSKAQYVGYAQAADLVESGKVVTSLHSVPFVVLIILSVSAVRAHAGYTALSQLLVTPFSAALSLSLSLALYPLLLVLVGHTPPGEVVRYGMIGIDVFIFWGWGILIVGAHTSNVLGQFLILELFNACAVIVMVLEGSTFDLAEKRGYPLVAESIIIFFWISVFSAFLSFWGLGLLLSTGANVGGLVRVLGPQEGAGLAHQLLLMGGMGLKGGIPPLGWWIFDFYAGLTPDQLAAYLGAFYLPLVAIVLGLGLALSVGFTGVDQTQRHGVAVGALGLILSLVDSRTVRGTMAISTVVSLGLVGVSLA